MPREKKFKKKVRDRALKTGESYSIARMRLNALPPTPFPSRASQPRTIRIDMMLHEEFREAIAGLPHVLAYFNEGEMVLRLQADELEEVSCLVDPLLSLAGSNARRSAVQEAATEIASKLRAAAAERSGSPADRSLRLGKASSFYPVLDALEFLGHYDASEWLSSAEVELVALDPPSTMVLLELTRLLSDRGAGEAFDPALDLLSSLKTDEPQTVLTAPVALFGYPDGVIAKAIAADVPTRPPSSIVPHVTLEGRLWVVVSYQIAPYDDLVSNVEVCELISSEDWIRDPLQLDPLYYGRQVRLKTRKDPYTLDRVVRLRPI